jgi:hypothetical protein
MTFKTLLDDWAARKASVKTKASYAVKLPINDAARIDALTEMFPGIDRERVITDLLSAALDYVEAAFPYIPGGAVIREDDQGDPVYEDVGLTPKFLALVKKHQKALETSD